MRFHISNITICDKCAENRTLEASNVTLFYYGKSIDLCSYCARELFKAQYKLHAVYQVDSFGNKVIWIDEDPLGVCFHAPGETVMCADLEHAEVLAAGYPINYPVS